MINGCYKYCNSHFVDTNEKKYRNEDKYMIHKFKAKGLNILLDVNSGGVHLIDDVTYDLKKIIYFPHLHTSDFLLYKKSCMQTGKMPDICRIHPFSQ